MANKKNFLLLFFFLPIFLVTFQIRAEETPSFACCVKMNGYRLSDYDGFEKKWHLITVRYRVDTGEMRYTYANAIAWKNLQKKTIDYPDGAVFIKIGLATQEDPAFASSKVPSGTRRYQLMVRNKKKHKDTDGWGYALFNTEGKTFPEDPQLAARACAACHRLVPDRGYVFSEIAELKPIFEKSITTQIPSKGQPPYTRLQFKTVTMETLPTNIQNILQENYYNKSMLKNSLKEIRLLSGDIVENTFHGTLDEIRPELSKEALRSGLPTILFSALNKQGQQQISLIYKNPTSRTCAEKKPTSVDMVSIISTDLQNKNAERKLFFCDSMSSI